MALNDLAEKYFPPGDHLEPSTQGVTLLMLATHTAGFPRDPTDIPNRLEKRNIEKYTTSDFFHFIDNWQVQGQLPAAYSYSNNGKLKQALGWSIRPQSPTDDRLIRKDGGTAGFSSVIVLCPAKDLAIFVVTNQGQAEASNIGTEIADRVRPGTN